jgi:hypothetical protein
MKGYIAALSLDYSTIEQAIERLVCQNEFESLSRIAEKS